MADVATNFDALTRFLETALKTDGGKGALYLRLEAALTEAIESGLIADGGAMPSERVLTEGLGISRVTVRAALERLAQHGVLLRRQGARTIVRRRMEKAPDLSSFTADMKARGRAPSNLWLARDIRPAELSESMALGLAPGAPVAHLARVRLADGIAIALEQAAIPAGFLPDPGSVELSLYERLMREGLAPHYGFQRVRALLATPDDAAHLGLAPGAPILAFERRTFLADGRALEFTRTRYSGAAYEYVSPISVQK